MKTILLVSGPGTLGALTEICLKSEGFNVLSFWRMEEILPHIDEANALCLDFEAMPLGENVKLLNVIQLQKPRMPILIMTGMLHLPAEFLNQTIIVKPIDRDIFLSWCRAVTM